MVLPGREDAKREQISKEELLVPCSPLSSIIENSVQIETVSIFRSLNVGENSAASYYYVVGFERITKLAYFADCSTKYST